MYGRTNKLRLPFSSLTEEFMVPRSREVLLWRDKKVSSAGIEGRTGRKWKAPEAVNQAEAQAADGNGPDGKRQLTGRSDGHS